MPLAVEHDEPTYDFLSLPGSPGAAGATGAAGTAGAPGPPGIWGEDGLDGDMGLPGPPGAAGVTGATGAVGPQGPMGVPGIDGDDGQDGRPGDRGATGPAGAPAAGLPLPYEDDAPIYDHGPVLQDLGPYLYLPGRPGGQDAAGGRDLADSLTLRPNGGGAGSTGNIIIDGTNDAPASIQPGLMQFNAPNNLSAAWTALGAFQNAITLAASGGVRAVSAGGSITFPAGSPNGVPFLVFNMGGSVILPESTATRLNSPVSYQNAPTITPPQTALTINNLATSVMAGFKDNPSFADSAAGITFRLGLAATPQKSGTYAAFYARLGRFGTAWLARRYAGLLVEPPNAGTGTIDFWSAVEIEDTSTWGGTYTNPPMTVHSRGTQAQMRHAGPAVFGADAAPSNASTALEVQSTTQAFRVPNMTTVQKNALTPLRGMIVYDTTLDQFHGYQGAVPGWAAM